MSAEAIERLRRKAQNEQTALALADALRDTERDRDALQDVLIRHGFVKCDIPACNCGSWHARYGYPERMREIADALEGAGHALSNENGHLALHALQQLIAERDALRAALIAAIEIVQQERLARSLADSRAFRIVVKRIAELDAIIAQADAALGSER